MPPSGREIELGFWHPHISGELTKDGWLKRYIEPAVESDRVRLRVECTQIVDAKLQKRALRAWCEVLPRPSPARGDATKMS
jgi:hypothetical protein